MRWPWYDAVRVMPALPCSRQHDEQCKIKYEVPLGNEVLNLSTGNQIYIFFNVESLILIKYAVVWCVCVSDKLKDKI